MHDFTRDGFQVLERVISPSDRQSLVAVLPNLHGTGSRNLLSKQPIKQAVSVLRQHADLRRAIAGLVAVQCTYFRKTLDHNWSLRLHRDNNLPVRGRGPWVDRIPKEGRYFVQPPRDFFDRCVAVRIALDPAPEGDVQIVPGSQVGDSFLTEPLLCPPVRERGALIMRPTIIHGSLRLRRAISRRVLHYVFAPDELPTGYQWYERI